ncbi:MAG: type II secretion system F family protein [Candidatus Omnitrophica bacterium]|nr:type II secretion system F family protein [Candidatus Omnitrophota bacterium]
MANFQYLARDKKGDSVENVIEAPSRFEAIGMLKSQGLTVVSVAPLIEKRIRTQTRREKIKKKQKRVREHKIGLRATAIFCRQLSVAVNAGITIMDALRFIAEDIEEPYFKQVLTEIVNDLRAGKHFSEALAKHKKIFSPLFVALMRTAEESGTMHKTLDYLSHYLEKSERLNRKIHSITAYPAFIFIFFILAILIFTLFVLPRFEAIFFDFGAQLPKITQIVFGVNRFLIRHFPIIASAVVAVMVAVVIYGRTIKGRYNIDKFKLKIPLFGELIRKSSLCKFCRNLGVMVSSGVSIEKAIKITSHVCNNKLLEESFEKVRQRIITGTDISGSLGREKVFPRLMVRMVGIGESSGRLVQMLDRISDMYEDEVEGTIMVATSLFEPVMIVVFGGIVLVMVLAIYFPVFKVAMTMRGG